MSKKLLLYSLSLLLINPFTMQAQSPDSIQTNFKMQYKIQGEGPALVLVPGGLTGWLSWDAFIPEFN
ncbi:MAG: hypothetical protein M3413_05540 [Bacteroidota bacterium]|nr:hypothetical protein [Bacteroidota bacterium]